MPNQIVSKTTTQGRPYDTIVSVFLNSIPGKPTVYQELSRTVFQFLNIIIKISVNQFYDNH